MVNERRAPLILERLEDRILLNAALPATGPLPVADVVLGPNEDFLLNEAFNFAVQFENASTNASAAGYQPYVDVVIPSGIEILSASGATQIGGTLYWDAADGRWETAANGSGTEVTEHPLTMQALTAGANNGDQLLIFEYPFGSFVPGQPAPNIDFTAAFSPDIGTNLGTPATVGMGLDISATGGFARGADQNTNPGVDPPLVGCADTATATPQIINLTKAIGTNSGPGVATEAEVGTGPNYPIEFVLSLDVADSQTVTNVSITDTLPAGLVLTSNPVVVTGATPDVGSDLDPTDGSFSVDFASLTGATGDDIVEITVTYTGYFADVVPDTDGNNNDDSRRQNDSRADADFGGMTFTDNDADTDVEFDVTLINVQKSVAVITDPGSNGATPGDTVRYTLAFQVSDYASFKNIVLDDVLGDGLTYVNNAMYSVTQAGVTSSGAIALGNQTAGAGAGGTTGIQFRLSDQLTADIGSGVLVGDIDADGVQNNGATTGFITFDAQIAQAFTAAAGDPSVDIGDTLNNAVTITAQATDNTGTDNRDIESDDSNAAINIAGGSVSKEVVAIDNVVNNEGVGTGQSVTYRLSFQIPTADAEAVVLTDYLPLPIFDVDDINAAGGITFDATPYDLTNPTTEQASLPPVGVARFTSAHNLGDFASVQQGGQFATPQITFDSNANTYIFNFGTFDSVDEGTARIDFVFTVPTSEVFVSDGLKLTNQVLATFNDTDVTPFSDIDNVQITILAPDISIKKSVVSVDRTDLVDPESSYGFLDPGVAGSPPFTAPITTAGLNADAIDSDLSGIDAGDSVKFALVIHNTGALDAHDLVISDVLPVAGYDLPTLGTVNLQIFTGSGTALALDGGTALDLFGAGIKISDLTATNGAIAAGYDGMGTDSTADDIVNATGSNIIIITYDLVASANIEAASAQMNTATVAEYAGLEGGTDLTAGNTLAQWEDAALTVAAPPSINKFFISSSEPSTTGMTATIGEQVTYELLITVPEGQVPDLRIQELVPAGMQYVAGSAQLITSSATSSNLTADFGGSVNNLVVTGGGGNGTTVIFDIDGASGPGSHDFASGDNSIANNSFAIRYTLVVLNDLANATNGGTLNNQGNITFTDRDGPDNNPATGSTTENVPSNLVAVTVVEPNVSIVKGILPANADAGDTVTITLTVSNTGGSDAFDVIVTDFVDPAKFSNVTQGTTPAGFIFNFGATPNTVTYSADAGVPGTVPNGGSVQFTFTAVLTAAVNAGETITNTATITQSTSLPGADPNERNEPVNDPSVDHSSSANVVIPGPSAVKNFIGTSIVDTSSGVSNDNTEVVIGENVIYELVVTVPEGQNGSVMITDTLDAGLAFVELVSITSSSANLTTTLGAGNFSDAIPAAPGATPFVNSVNNVTNQAQQVVFNLGSINNSDNEDGSPNTPETITLRYIATVLNVAGNQSTTNEGGPALGNSAVVNFNNGTGPASQAAVTSGTDVRIIEPVLVTNKSVSVAGGGTNGDAGDAVTYTIRVQHDASSETAAYDVSFSDDIPNEIINILPGGFNVTSNAGVTAADFNFTAGANTIASIADIDLQLGQFFEITITGTIDPAISVGQDLVNTASASWSNQDGGVTNTSEYVGDGSDEERDGAGGIDNYTDQGSATIAIAAATIDKLAPTPSNYTIGDIVTYNIVVNLSEGLIEDLVVLDNIPTGMAYIPGSAQIITNAAASGGLLTGDYSGTLTATPAITAPGGSGGDVRFDFGNTTTTQDNSTTNNSFVIQLQTRVLNIAANQSTNTLTNNADLQFTDPVSSVTQTINDPTDPIVTIVEPDLLVDKQILTPTTNVDAGDTVRYEIRVLHTPTSNANAYDINLTDNFSGFLENIAIVSANIDGTNVASLFTINGSDDLVPVDVNGVDLLLNQVLTIVVEGTVLNSVNIGDVISNNVDINWSSQDDAVGGPANPNERGGAGGVNDYAANDAADNITVPGSLDVVKTASAGTATVGDILTYTLTVNISEGTLENLDINDTIPTGFSFVPNSVRIVNNGDITFAGVNLADLQASGNATLGGGNVLAIDIANVVNPGGSNASANNGGVLETDSFQITYQIKVDNDQTNITNGAVLTNDADASADGGLSDNDNQVDVTIAEPQLQTDKNLLTSSAAVDAGDTVSYEIIVSHNASSGADAFDLNVTDDIPDILENVSITAFIGTTNVGPTGSGIIFLNGTGDIATMSNALDLLQGQSLRIVITGDVKDSVVAGETISNSVALSWSSQNDNPGDPANPDERDGDDDYNEMDPADNINVPVAGTFSVAKLADVASATVGDVVTYTLRVSVFEGTTNNIRIVDTLPTGFAYQAGSAVVSNANGITLNGFTAGIGGQTLTVDVASAVNPGNADNAATLDTDFFDITYRVLLTNTADITNGDTKTNDADATAAGVPADVDNQVDVRVIEPQLNIQKDLLTPSTGVGAGDTVTYRLTVSHLGSSSANAYDLNISDDLPNILTGITLNSALVNGTTDVSGLLSIVGGNLVTPDPNALDLALGQTLVIEISGTISVGLGPTDVISNNADLTWTGQNDPAGGGNNPNERGGDGTGENDYNDNDPGNNITAANTFNVTKTANSATATIGEILTYTLNVELIDGTTNNIQIVDTLPAGLVYQAGSAVIANAADMTINGFAAAPAGQVLTISMTDVTNPAGGGSSFQITYQVRVDNTADNRNGDSQTNDADASANGVPNDVDNQVSVSITEPQLEINKNLLSSSANVDAGDIVQYEIIISHTTSSSAPAFDLNIMDDMPAILENVSIISALIDGATDIRGLLNINGANDLETPDPTQIDLGLGRTIRIVIQGEVRDSAVPGSSFVNGADVTWTSLDGVDPNERGAAGGGENDYSDSDPAPSITVPGTLQVTKIANTAQATIGDIVTYTLQITVVEGTTNNLRIVDTLPNALLYQAGTAMISNANGMTIAAPAITPAGQTLTIDIASITNPGNSNNSALLDGDTFDISYQVLVANNPANQAGDVKTNDADVTADGVPADLNNQVDVAIVAPRLDITKVAADDTPHYGDEVTYTVRVNHDQDGMGLDSLASAFDLVIADMVASPGLTFVDNSVTLVSTTGATNVVVTDQVGNLEIRADSLALGGVIEFTYRATATNDAATNPLGSQFSNTAALRYDTQAGVDPNERVLEDEALEQVVIVGADLSISKDNGGFSLIPGLTGTYTLTVSNNGTDTATGVTITDNLPPGLTFKSASNGGAETAPGSGIVVWNGLADIPIGGSLMVTLTVDVTNPVPFGVVNYTNNSTVGHNNVDPTPANNSDNDVDLLDPTGGPDLAVSKTVNAGSFTPGDNVSYTITVTNIGNQNASGVILSDVFPTAALNFVSVGANNAGPSGDHTFLSFDGTSLRWNLDVVNVGEIVTVNVNAAVKDPLPVLITDFTNSASVVDDGSGNPDLNPNNNADTSTANVVAAPDIQVTKTNNSERVQPLDSVTYSITVANVGKQNATGITVTDVVDLSIYENVTPSSNFLTSFNIATGEIVWTIPALNGGGGSIQLEITATVKINIPPGVNTASNTVFAKDDGSNGPDSNPNNNTSTDKDELLVFAFDGVRDEVFGEDEPGFRDPEEDERFKEPLPISTLYSGWTEPGTTLKFKVFDEHGVELGEQVVVADTAGNWVANFAHVYISDHPHDMIVTEDQPVYNASTLGSFNLRTYFAPSYHGQVFFLHTPTINSVFSNTGENALDSIHQGLTNPVQLGWDKTYGYEYLASSTTTTQSRE